MAAGIVYHAITTSVGVTFDVGSWVPDTGAPDDNAVPVHYSFDTTGAEVWTAAKITTMFGYLDQIEGYLDGLETLVTATNAALAGTLTVGSHAVTNAGTFAVQAASAGDTAHDAADNGNPIKVGGKAVAGLSGLTLPAANDRVNASFQLDGAQVVRTHCGLEDIVSGASSNTDGSSTEVIATAGAGVKQYLTRVSLSNTHATTAVMVALKSGSTSKYRVIVPPSSGREIFFDPPLPPNAANEAWNFDPDAAVTTIECSMVGFKSKV
jgi:hypothetical protein